MKAIVAVDREWGIGKGNDLLFSIPEDMKFFRTTTTGKVIVIGRKTLESFPGGKPLKNRTNVVLTRNGSWDGVISVNGIEALMREISGFSDDDVYVCGGASVYKELLDYCKEALVTKVDAIGGAEAFFPNLDELQNWELICESETIESNGFKISFCTYRNSCVKK
jgi:dihydrofolate reductase